MRATSLARSFHASRVQLSFTSSVSDISNRGYTEPDLRVAFFVILISIGCHIYILPRLHDIRETLLAKALWIAPAFCSLLLGICIVMDFALLGQLSSDPVVAEATQAERGQVSSSPVSPGGALFL